MPDWLQIVLGTSAPVIAVCGVYVGYQQWKLGVYKLRHDLFEKRWKVYAATNDVIVSIIRCDATEQFNLYAEFKRRKLDAKFLFRPKLNNYLGEVDSAFQELQTANRTLKSAEMIANSPERNEVEKQVLAQTEWLRSQLEGIEPMFHEYLDFSQL